MIRFYDGLLGEERLLCEYSDMLISPFPIIGDMLELPINKDINDINKDIWVIKQRLIEPDGISYFCELYNWED